METNAAVALVTTDPQWIDYEYDIVSSVQALTAQGMHVTLANWHDQATDWGAFDLIIMNSPWDYPEHAADFQAWLAALPHQNRVLNPPALIKWNLDKTYLLDLARQQVPITPSQLCSDLAQVAAAVNTTPGPNVIIKPTVGAGSRGAGLFNKADPALLDWAKAQFAAGKATLLVQEELTTVTTHGEHGLVYFNGQYSHCIRKGPILKMGGGFLHGKYTEEITPAEPTQAELDVATHALAAVGQIIAQKQLAVSNPMPLYARFDLGNLHGNPVVIEIELFEPSLFLYTKDGAAQAFAAAVAARL